MDKDKKKRKEEFFEALLEIVFSVIFFGIGAFIFSAFGFKLDSPNLDFESIVLIGLIVTVVALGLGCTVVQLLKKIFKGNRK